MTRVSQEDLTDAQIAEFDGAGGLMPKGEPEPGFGLAAFWSSQAHQLQIIPDRRHYAAIVYRAALSLPGAAPTPGPDPKAVATKLGKALL